MHRATYAQRSMEKTQLEDMVPEPSKVLPNTLLGGFHQHTSAIGELLTSLYAVGSARRLSAPDDPGSGVSSMRAVIDRLNTSGLTHVISLDAHLGQVLCQSKCRVATLANVVASHGLWLDLPPTLFKTTVGAAALRGQIPPNRVEWVEVLTTNGLITRHQIGQLPPDALVLVVCLTLHI